MPLTGTFAVATVLVLVLCAPPLCHGAPNHSISDILAAHPDLSEFSSALNSTGIAAEIDKSTTITVLAVDNAVMARLKALNLGMVDFRHAISFHVLLDYFDADKLSSIQGGVAQASTFYQASGEAPGGAGMVTITTHTGGRFAFAQSDAAAAPPVAFYQKTITKSPYDIAVLQVSAPISPTAAKAAEAPAPAPGGVAPRLTDLLSKNGCGAFAGLVAASPDAAAVYDRRNGGLTVFCPSDKAVEAFSPTFKNLTADAQAALLLYHGLPARYSNQSLKSINGDVNTLATDGSKGYSYNLTVRADGDKVKLTSSSPTAATVAKTLVETPAVAAYLIDTVLMPRELFNKSKGGPTAPSPSPSPASSAPARAPKASAAPAVAPAPATHAPASHPAPSGSPAPSPDADNEPPADEKSNGVSGTASWTLGAAVPAAIVLAMW